MILHPDGRVEGTPAEIAQYQKTKQAAPQPVIGGMSPWKPWGEWIPPVGPVTVPCWPPSYPLPQTWCGTGSTTPQPRIRTIPMN